MALHGPLEFRIAAADLLSHCIMRGSAHEHHLTGRCNFTRCQQGGSVLNVNRSFAGCGMFRYCVPSVYPIAFNSILRLNQIGSILHSNIVLIHITVCPPSLCLLSGSVRKAHIAHQIRGAHIMNSMELKTMEKYCSVASLLLCITHYYKYEIRGNLCATTMITSVDTTLAKH